jgi:nucleoside-diphosphate-sugar epimerase
MTFDLSGRNVLVIGGAGYVGSVLVRRLLAANANVRVLDQLIYDNGFALQSVLDSTPLTIVRGDLRDERTVTAAANGADDVVLLAALVGDPVCRKYPELAEQVNDAAARRLVDRLDELGVHRFVFTSTCSNYGIHDSAVLADEHSELNPQSLYARTKIAVEEHILATAPASRAATTVLRIATAYGLSPRMRFDLTVSQFARELATGTELLVYDADTWRPYCHVRDIAKAITTVLSAPRSAVHGEVFNVGDTAQQFTKKMIVDELRKHISDAAVTYRSGDADPRNYRVSFDKIARVLGFRTDHALADHVAALVAAIQAGTFAGSVDEKVKYGNHEVRHLLATPGRATDQITGLADPRSWEGASQRALE